MAEFSDRDDRRAQPAAKVVFVTGPSGAGRTTAINALEEFIAKDFHIIFLKYDRDGNNHRKIFGRSFIIVLHRENCLIPFAHKNDHRCVVVEILLRTRDVESTKGEERRTP